MKLREGCVRLTTKPTRKGEGQWRERTGGVLFLAEPLARAIPGGATACDQAGY